MSVTFGTTSFWRETRVGRGRKGVGHGVGFDAGDEVIATREQAKNDFGGGVVGVGDKEERLVDGEGGEEQHHFIEEGSVVAIGEAEALVDLASEGDGEDAGGGLQEDGDGLAGMAEDEFGLGIGIGDLMNSLDGWHF